MAFEIDVRDLPDHGRYTMNAPFVRADAAGRCAYHSNLKCAPRDDHLAGECRPGQRGGEGALRSLRRVRDIGSSLHRDWAGVSSCLISSPVPTTSDWSAPCRS